MVGEAFGVNLWTSLWASMVWTIVVLLFAVLPIAFAVWLFLSVRRLRAEVGELDRKMDDLTSRLD